VVNQFVEHDAHLMTDQHHGLCKIAKNYAGHSSVNHLRKEYSRGDTHTNTAESFGALLERIKQGIFHHMSKKHLWRYLNEIGFRWDHRIPEIKTTKNGKTKKYMRPMPFIDKLNSLLSRAAGRQVRRTINSGITSLNISFTDNLQPYYCS
jgi:hypothetical protein